MTNHRRTLVFCPFCNFFFFFFCFSFFYFFYLFNHVSLFVCFVFISWNVFCFFFYFFFSCLVSGYVGHGRVVTYMFGIICCFFCFVFSMCWFGAKDELCDRHVSSKIRVNSNSQQLLVENGNVLYSGSQCKRCIDCILAQETICISLKFISQCTHHSLENIVTIYSSSDICCHFLQKKYHLFEGYF